MSAVRLTTKAAPARTFVGIASTPRPDRMGDVVDPKGATFATPFPLLWQHRHDAPIGWVRAVRVTDEAIEVRAEVAAGIPAADAAWQQIEAGLVAHLSVGFRGIKHEAKSGGLHWKQWELLELSVVTIPANSDARILRIGDQPAKSASTGGVKLIATR